MKTKHLLFTASIVLAIAGCKHADPKNAANTIYYGGDILTMEGDSPTYAEAVVVKDGKIAYVGSKAGADSLKGDSTTMIDLQGKTMLPGFIDAHGHVWNAGVQALTANLLAPPDGKVTDIADVIATVKAWGAKNGKAVSKIGWMIGFGYDEANLKEKRHPTADDLDKISTDVPVLIVHQSGHFGVMNHKALAMSGITSASIDPPGGVIRRKPGTNEPNGVLEEMGFFIPVFKILGAVDKATGEKIAEAGIASYTSFGFTTAQEGRATKEACEIWSNLAKEGKLSIDVAAYPDIQSQMAYMKEKGVSKTYDNHYRIAGVKLSLDGSLGGRTAWMKQPYLNPPPGQPKTYRAYAAIPDDSKVNAFVDSAFKNNWQIITHVNGDAAIAQYLRAVAQAAKIYGNNDRRTVAIHTQTASDAQLDSMKTLGIIPSFFGMHTFYWGDWHVDETLGKERAYRIDPAESAIKKGMIFTEHHDAPVALPNSIMILYCAVNRISRASGQVIGADERISPYNALRSITTYAAYQYFEENSKGTIKTGKLADFVILDKNPVKIDPKTIIDIKVLQTIKEDKTVYKRL